MGIADLELRVIGAAAGGSARVLLTLPDGQATAMLARDIPLELDPVALRALGDDPSGYGEALTAQLFAAPALAGAWARARALADGAGAPLRIRIALDEASPELQTLRWETLRDPALGAPLALSERVLLSRWRDSGELTPAAAPARPALRALLVVASPTDLATFNLDPIDGKALARELRPALRPARLRLVGPGAATRARLARELRARPHLVIIVCHGRLVGGASYLELERRDGRADHVPARELVELVLSAPQRPLLAVVAACHSAGSAGAEEMVEATGPALASAGVPAVIGMRDLVTLEAVRALLPALARELVTDGVIDRALAAARAESPGGAGWSQAVLWMRLRDGRLWHGTPVAPPPPWRRPADRRSPRAWWEWLHFHRGRLLRGAARLLALYLALAALVALPPFHPRPGWRALGPRPPVKAIALGGLDGTILLGSSTDATGCSPDTGIWRSADGGASWEAVPTPLALGDEPCATVAAVRGFASSPADPGVLYAATGQAGLVRSDGAEGVGVGWAQVGSGALPASLRAVAVAPDDGERLFVAGDPGRLYRSTDGGARWDRLDGAALCPAPGGRLPEQLDARALLAAPGAIFVATWGSATAAAEPAGIYASADGGTCWSLLHSGARRYRYIALAAHGEDRVLALTYDFQGDPGEEYQLWSIPRRGGQPAMLWQDDRRARALYVDQATPQHWYVVDSGAAMVRGSLAAGAGPPDAYAPQLRCLFACNVALAPDPAGGQMPLLLAEDQVYRFGLVAWYRALWP